MRRSSDSEVEQVGIRPYARLLTMLGEQLIKNDRVALVELLKNCYDADASRVKVVFVDFGNGLSAQEESSLVVVDNGKGMTEKIIREHWLNPATAVKADLKKVAPMTAKKRTIQGEKGIGRFAIFKLGSVATVTTRASGGDTEFVLDYDLAFLDSDNDEADEDLGDTTSPRFLDEVRIGMKERPPQVFDGVSLDGLESTHGTRIEIQNLRSPWSEKSAKRVYDDVARLQPLVPAKEFELPEASEEFKVEFWTDKKELPFHDNFEDQLLDLFMNRAVLKINGMFDSNAGQFEFEVNDEHNSMDINDPKLTGLQVHRNYFGQTSRSSRGTSNLACGPFMFSFYIFDLSGTGPAKYHLDSDEKGLVKEHRIYLYRDGIRVLPYGDPEDDWLQLDVIRGTQAARRVPSNQQTVGFVHITHSDNPMLRDKTNREGLLDEGDAYNDFVAVLQTIIAYIRAKPYEQYLSQKRRQREVSQRQRTDVAKALLDLEENPDLPTTLGDVVKRVRSSYLREQAFLKMRAERTEDLAGVGLSVETASHDILAAGGQALRITRLMSKYIKENMPSNTHLRTQVDSLIDLLSFVSSRLNDVQGLFVSTRRRRKTVDVAEFAERIGSMFRFAMKEDEIAFEVSQPNGELRVKVVEAALLQALLNLVDNAIFWLGTVDKNRQITIEVQAEEHQLIVADNGPGVDIDDEPYIFEPFYSGKGLDGKGLGLYIARQVGMRHGFDVFHSDQQPILSGANFVIAFEDGQT